MDIEVVIGANYGDEGKGLFTEYLCRIKSSPIVVLSNGGCQRGHTVNNIEKRIQHIFHHFGSGTIIGIPTVFSKTFLLNPIKFIEEKRELENENIHPVAFRASGCLLQLPGDMLVNQATEKARGLGKHGSCGWGIWETKVRNQQHHMLTFDEFESFDYAKKKATYLDCLEWQLCNRLHGIYKPHYVKELMYIKEEGFIKHFIQDFEEMSKDVKSVGANDLVDVGWEKFLHKDINTLVVENGQGLLLDSEYAPKDENGFTTIHATPSRCGLAGSLEAVGKTTCDDNIVANYVTRTYFTRHGAGPFPEETPNLEYDDKTNMPNDYQDSMKFGVMTDSHAEKLIKRVEHDAFDGVGKASKLNIVATHCNEAMLPSILKHKCTCMSYEDDSKKVVRNEQIPEDEDIH